MNAFSNLKSAGTILFVAMWVVSGAALAQEGPTSAEYGTVLNLSGKQRMLTQKMSKEILLIALNCDKPANIANLRSTAALFDKTIVGLRDGDSSLGLPPTVSKRIVRQLDKTESIWRPFQSTVEGLLANGSVTAEDVQMIAAGNLPLLKEMNRCVKLYEKDAAKSGLEADPGLAVTINLAGKQRMLTQKMSKEFLLVAFGHETDANRMRLLETVTLFDRTLVGLRHGDPTLDLPGTEDGQILEQLAVIDGLWQEFKLQVESATGSAAAQISADEIQALAATNLPLLIEMNKAVGMYERQAAGQGPSS